MTTGDTGEPMEPAPLDPAVTGVVYPMGWEDWSVIGMAHRLDNSQVRVVVGNAIAVTAARDALPDRPDSWPEGSILVDVVRPQDDNPNWPEMQAAGDFAAIAVMEKDSSRFADTGGWGYGFWNSMLVPPADGPPLGDASTSTDETTCFGCHNVRVPDQDYVFTQPLPFFTDDQVENAAEGDNSTLPADVTSWSVLSIHHRTDNDQMRVVLGNPIAVNAWRAGEVNPDWPDGTMLADFVFAGEELAETDEPASINMHVPTTAAVVAFMERDSTRFADSDDWGYQAWGLDGDSLIQTASNGDPSDMASCYGCHLMLVSDNGFVFSQPGGLPNNLP